MLSLMQIAAILGVLSAFGVSQPIIDSVHHDLDSSFAVSVSSPAPAPQGVGASAPVAGATIPTMNDNAAEKETLRKTRGIGRTIGDLSLIGGRLTVSVQGAFDDDVVSIKVGGKEVHLTRGCNKIVGSALSECGYNSDTVKEGGIIMGALEVSTTTPTDVEYTVNALTRTVTVGPGDVGQSPVNLY